MTSVSLPQTPGVYFMIGADGCIIYVGKANNIAKRVSYYTSQQRNHSDRIQALVKAINKIDFISTETEAQALIIEDNLIKSHRPRYNVALIDAFFYPYIKITNEIYPQVIKVKTRIKDKGEYFGPFTSSKSVDRTIKVIRDVFHIRTSIKKLPIYRANERPCLNYHMKKCYGCCIGGISPEDYARQCVLPARMFLRGSYKKLHQQLLSQIDACAKDLRFEEAAILRDRLKASQHIASIQHEWDLPESLSQDVIGIGQVGNLSCLLVLQIRHGALINRYHKTINTAGAEREEILESFLRAYPHHTSYWPEEILLPVAIEGKDAFVSYLKHHSGGTDIKLSDPPKKGRSLQLLDMANKNAVLSLQYSLPHPGFLEKQGVLEELVKVLGLSGIPKRIEGWDISNTEGSYAVASLVCFEDGLPSRRGYRIFRIRSITGPDDYGMMREGMTRHYSRLLSEPKSLPSLILVDGGKGQLNVAHKVLDELGLIIPVVGLAKKNEWLHTRSVPDSPLKLPHHNLALRLLQHVRDEAHRHGNSFHRRWRGERTVRSVLEDIPGIGPKRRTILYQTFSSLADILSAGEETLARLNGMNRAAARAIVQNLGSSQKSGQI